MICLACCTQSENPTEGWNYVDLAPDEEKYLEPVMNFSKTKSIWLEKRNICTISRMAMELKMPGLRKPSTYKYRVMQKTEPTHLSIKFFILTIPFFQVVVVD